MSTGNGLVEIHLDQFQSTLIRGTNGAGKSSGLLESLYFGLYGKPFRKINKGQLVNNLNKKGLVVEIEFDAGGHEYLVRRGIKPDLFEIHRDGEQLNQNAAARDDQQYLEDHILKMNGKAFMQVALLGRATYIPFMQLSPAQRREIVEDLLDIQTLGQMATLCKEELNSLKKTIEKCNNDLDLVEVKIEGEKSKAQALLEQQQRVVEDLKSQIQGQIKVVETAKAKVEGYRTEYDGAVEKEKVFNVQIKELKRQKQESDNEAGFLLKSVGPIKDTIAFFKKHEECPTCQQDITASTRHVKIADAEDSIANINSKVEAYKQTSSNLQVQISEVQEEIESLQGTKIEMVSRQSDVSGAKSTLDTLAGQLKRATSAMQVEDVDSSVLDNLEKKKLMIGKAINKLNHDKLVATIAQAALKDDGIRASIIEQYLPVINSTISTYLEKFELFVNFTISNTFEETITTGNGDLFTYNSFSEGERLRIDLAILLTWRTIAKMRNSASTNILLMDEILDSSLDNEGTLGLIDTLKDLHSNDNVIIVSHKGDGLDEKFDRIINVKKVKGFSVYTEEVNN